MATPMVAGWLKFAKEIEGIVLDIAGVLYDSGDGDGVPIPGSIEAVNRLKASGVPVRFCTNATETTRVNLVAKLNRIGFSLEPNEVFPPAPAVCQILKERGLRPHLLVADDCKPDLAGVEQHDPTCVVIGDAAHGFTYDSMNKAFQALMQMEKPLLISMGQGKYYLETDGLKLDCGPFMKALEYACSLEAEIVGKPSKTFFDAVLKDIGISSDKALMIGDDVVSDVGGAQACGMRALLVRTGKYRPTDEKHPTVTPDGVVDNLQQAVELFLSCRDK
ncbi:PREDICTED: phospholysine phosphohistidine inorganic pyrophosphate phosphatase-like [Priapulus caudatus]|uniref:Phospholysine phosphohistidine inorganic pyrophosphate phosphatase n=1 Tax=Priapulus caudatus TaxID=37621 RepID=A0ABM1E2D0_PRICU|nr:PREDICTED: phospholysine phosphohistidine inorganic pyrophosphate phosphatase-like [Priapulus caudatus]